MYKFYFLCILSLLLFSCEPSNVFNLNVVNQLEESVVLYSDNLEEIALDGETLGPNDNFTYGPFPENTLIYFEAYNLDNVLVDDMFLTVTDRKEAIWVIME